MNKPVPAARFTPDDDIDDNPEWTDEDFARARPASEVLPPAIAAALSRQPAEMVQEEVTLDLDSDVLAKFQATGPGWQTRINEALRAAKV